MLATTQYPSWSHARSAARSSAVKSDSFLRLLGFAVLRTGARLREGRVPYPPTGPSVGHRSNRWRYRYGHYWLCDARSHVVVGGPFYSRLCAKSKPGHTCAYSMVDARENCREHDNDWITVCYRNAQQAQVSYCGIKGTSGLFRCPCCHGPAVWVSRHGTRKTGSANQSAYPRP